MEARRAKDAAPQHKQVRVNKAQPPHLTLHHVLHHRALGIVSGAAGGSGSGGRIAIATPSNQFTGVVLAPGGGGYNSGGPGTVRCPGTVCVGNAGVPFPCPPHSGQAAMD